jgi:SAM-dependent methyltransferase
VIDSSYSQARTTRFRAFIAWTSEHIVGDEKGEAQIFLDRLFQAFGHLGVKEAGATLEMRVKKSATGTSFADLVWKPLVLIEMKRRGEDLGRHYRQAFDYWTRLVPDRPRYVVLCNFDEFWIYDFETQMDTPLEKLRLTDLADHYGPLAFLFVAPEKPVFKHDQEAVTRHAADDLAQTFSSLHGRGIPRDVAQRFVLQLLVALFAEDIQLLEKYLVFRLLEDCKDPRESYDLLGGLFEAMNTPGQTPGGRYKGVPYFNGGLFASPARVELNEAELSLLRSAANSDWSKVRPEIFGTLFEHSLDSDERHTLGAHYTSAADIMRVVGPTIVQPWTERIENASTLAELRKLVSRLHRYRVLDPACGSGNFLYIAYREVKRLEARLFELIQIKSKRANPDQHELGFVTAANFFGIDINPFAIELAKVTMMIGRKLAIDELNITENALPLDNLDANFVVGDALLQDDKPRIWPDADVIIGNPPYLGAKLLKPEKGDAYVRAIRRAYPGVPGMADYCVYWFRKTQDALALCTADDPFAGRAGLVGTQNIRSNASRIGGLDYIVESGTIIDAVQDHIWSGEAKVHVSIVNWVNSQDPRVLPKHRRLWFRIDKSNLVESARIRRLAGPRSQSELGVRDVKQINSALADTADLSKSSVLHANISPPICFQGVVPGYDGFVISLLERAELLAKDSRLTEVVRPYLIGRDVVTGTGAPSRAIIDFAKLDMFSARAYADAFELIERTVLPSVVSTLERSVGTDMESARKQHLDRWWQFWNVRVSMRAALRAIPRYLACSRVTKRPIFVFVDPSITPDSALQVFALADDYSFGLLQSDAHWQWFIANCSKLKSDFRYTPGSVFDTFPWPQHPSLESVDTVAECGRRLRDAREKAAGKISGGLRAVYRAMDLPGKNSVQEAQAELDKAVAVAYGFNSELPLMPQLQALNERLAQLPQESVTGPGIPPDYRDHENLISFDRVTATLPQQR